MKNKTKLSIWVERPYIDYLSEVDRLLYEQYGITTDDAGMEIVAASQEAGDTPQQLVNWYAAHYELEPIPV